VKASSSLVIKVVYERDGRPAQDVTVIVHDDSEIGPLPSIHEARTDSGGVCVFKGLSAGRYSVFADREGLRGAVKVEIEGNQEKEIELGLPPGFDVHGHVVDEHGKAIPGADIWLSMFDNYWGGRVVTRSDGRGSFSISCIAHSARLCARADEYMPSAVEYVESRTTRPVEIELALRSGGGSLAGTILDSDGKPAVAATVLVEHRHRRRLWSNEIPFWTRVDERGHFELLGLETGRTRLTARARNHAPWQTLLRISRSRNRPLSIRLVRGATVEGKVFDPQGRPAGAAVFVGDLHSFASSWTRSREGGTYRIDDVVPGDFEVVAEHDRYGRDRAALHALSGETVHFDPVLNPGRVIRGRVIDKDGNQLESYHVNLRQTSPGRSGREARHVVTDAGGCFEFAACVNTDHVLTVSFPPGGSSDAACLPIVRPMRKERVIVVDTARSPSVFFEGRVVDEAGRPVERAGLLIWERGQSSAPVVQCKPDTGRFHHGPYSPGKHRIHIHADGYVAVEVSEVEVVAGETRDVGEITLRKGGTLRANFLASEARLLKNLEVWAEALLDGKRSNLYCPRGEGQPRTLAPGDYLLHWSGSRCAASLRPFCIELDRETAVHVEVQQGIPLRIKLLGRPAFSAVEPRDTSLIVHVLNSDGKVISGTLVQASAWKSLLTFHHSPGSYEIRWAVLDASELSATCKQTVRVDDQTPGRPPIEIEVARMKK